MGFIARTIFVMGATIAVVATAGCGVVTSSGAGSCAAKKIVLGDTSPHPGARLSVRVDWMTETCEDTGGVNRSARDMRVTITPSSGSDYALGTIASTSGPRFTAEGDYVLPDDFPLGTATLTVASPVGDEATATREVVVTAE